MKKHIHTSLLIILCGFIAGCMNVKYPQRSTYALKVHTTKISSRKLAHTLEIANVSIKPQFENCTFVYRTSNTSYISDYYNIFFNPPAQQVSQLTEKYLDHSGLFNYVTDHYGYVRPDYVVQLDILELYADYRNSACPKAVISIRFTVIKKINHKTRVLMNKTYKQAIPLQAKTSDSLIDGWSRGLSKILYQSTYDLKKLIIQMRGQQSVQHKPTVKAQK